jgi:hypothetical protein
MQIAERRVARRSRKSQTVPAQYIRERHTARPKLYSSNVGY